LDFDAEASTYFTQEEIGTVPPRFFSFVGGDQGQWRVASMTTIVGAPLPAVARVEIVPDSVSRPEAAWILRGMTSNERYVSRPEKTLLVERQRDLGRAESTCAAIIPIRKSAAWWALTQDERRDILAEQSKHIQIGLQYLPGISRRLHHCRDLSENEPFDFVTQFDYVPGDQDAFNRLLAELRATEEWKYVEREVDIRMTSG
jgi:hypothetical protein